MSLEKNKQTLQMIDWYWDADLDTHDKVLVIVNEWLRVRSLRHKSMKHPICCTGGSFEECITIMLVDDLGSQELTAKQAIVAKFLTKPTPNS